MIRAVLVMSPVSSGLPGRGRVRRFFDRGEIDVPDPFEPVRLEGRPVPVHAHDPVVGRVDVGPAAGGRLYERVDVLIRRRLVLEDHDRGAGGRAVRAIEASPDKVAPEQVAGGVPRRARRGCRHPGRRRLEAPGGEDREGDEHQGKGDERRAHTIQYWSHYLMNGTPYPDAGETQWAHLIADPTREVSP